MPKEVEYLINATSLLSPSFSSIKSILSNSLERLDRCQRSLNDFLEEKRSSFPRFYFIGDDDLLQILGQATRPAVIQAHLKKLFAGIHSVGFDQEEKHIVAMNSIDGEVVPLKNKVRTSLPSLGIGRRYVQFPIHCRFAFRPKSSPG